MPDNLLSKPKLQSSALAEWQPPRALRAAQKATSIGPDTTVPSREGASGALNKLMSLITGVGIYPEDSTGPADVLMGALPLAGAIKGMPGFYSRLERAAAGLPEKALHPSKLMALLKNSVEGVSGDELAYRKVPEFLDGALGSVRKNDFLSHLEGHPAPMVTQRTFGGPPSTEGWRIERTPNIHTQREYGGPAWEVIGPHGPTGLMFGNEDSARHALEAQAKATVQPHFNSPSLQVPGGTSYRERAFEMPENAMSAVSFREGHFPVSHESGNVAPLNQIGHTRWNERPLASGELGRHVEELQSDWASRGYNDGFIEPNDPVNLISQERDQAIRDVARVLGLPEPRTAGELQTIINRTNDRSDTLFHHSAAARLRSITDRFAQVFHPDGKVPPFPFFQQWPDLMLKQHLLDVSGEADKKWLGFTTGDVQNDRYDLRKHIGNVKYVPDTSRAYEIGQPNGGDLTVLDPTGRVVIQDNVTRDELHRHISRELADKLLASPLHPDAEGGAFHHLTGLDLTVGGEGKRQLYDKMFPSKFDRLVRPFGGRVESGEAVALRPQARAGAMNSGHLVVDEPETEGMFTGAKWHTVADLLPKGANDPMALRALAEQVNASRNRFPRTTPTWFTSLTPEMKAAILKKGFPLLGLTGGIMASQGEGEP